MYRKALSNLLNPLTKDFVLEAVGKDHWQMAEKMVKAQCSSDTIQEHDRLMNRIVEYTTLASPESFALAILMRLSAAVILIAAEEPMLAVMCAVHLAGDIADLFDQYLARSNGHRPDEALMEAFALVLPDDYEPSRDCPVETVDSLIDIATRHLRLQTAVDRSVVVKKVLQFGLLSRRQKMPLPGLS
jgi:hypothetical protein